MNDDTITTAEAPSRLYLQPGTCNKCRFAAPVKMTPNFACRRYPPTVTHIAQQRGNMINFLGHADFPQVRPDAWCGEFKPMVDIHQ